jgi:hypothetical protein
MGRRTLVLPGRLPETVSWAKQLCREVGSKLEPCTIAEYSHWTSGDLPEVPGEAGKISDIQPTWIIAKSMDTLVASFAQAQSGLMARKAVFMGSPVQAYTDADAERLVRFCAAIPTLFIQQAADYTGSFEQMQELTQDCANCERIEIPGSDHVYGEFDTLVPLIRSWLGITPPPS